MVEACAFAVRSAIPRSAPIRDARWILSEAGALSKTKDARVCNLLLDVKPADVVDPLAQPAIGR